MTNEELLYLMQHTDADKEFLDELQNTLQAELEKPVEKRDFALIEDLSKTISEIRGTEATISARSDAGISRLNQYFSNRETGGRPIRIRYLIAAVCAIVLITSNVLSYSVFGMNAFSAAVQLKDGEIKISFQESNVSNIESYAEEILAVCKNNGFIPIVPHYFPAGMKPTDDWGSVSNYNLWEEIIFSLKYKKSSLIFQYRNIKETEYVPDIGVPTDSYKLSEESICGTTVYFFQQNKEEFNALFIIDQVQYFIYTDGLEEIEFRKVLYSMFE